MPKLFKHILLLIILFFVISGKTGAQNQGIFKETSYIKNYGINDFGNLVFINHISEDPNGCIITATTDGISILNSTKFQSLTTPARSGINIVECSSDGQIFVCGDVDCGFFTFNAQGKYLYQSIITKQELKNDNINNLIINNKEVYLIGNSNIYKYKNGAIEKLGLINIKSSFRYDTIPIIITRDGGLHIISGKLTKEIFNIKQLKTPSNEDIKIVNANNDSIYLISREKIYKLASIKIKEACKLSTSDFAETEIKCPELKGYTINDVQYDGVLNKMAIATNHGILIMDTQGNHLQSINYTNGLEQEDIKKLFFDSKHNLWASLGSSLSKIELNSATVYYTERQGISGDLYCFEKFNDYYYCSTFNDIYVATAEKSGHNTVFEKVNMNNNEPNITCWKLKVIEDKLLACTKDGLYQIDGKTGHKILSTNKIYDISECELLPGVLLIAGYDGLFAVDYKIAGDSFTFRNYRKIKGIDFPVWTIMTDHKQMIWISTIFNGLYYITPKDKRLDKYGMVNIGENCNLKDLRQTRFNVTDKYLYTYGESFQRATLPEKTDFLSNEIKLEQSATFSSYLNNFTETEVFPIGNGDVFINTNSDFIMAYKEDKRFDTIRFQAKIKIVNSVFLRDSILFLSTNLGLLKHNLKSKPYETPGKYPFNVIINGISANDSVLFAGSHYFKRGEKHIYSGKSKVKHDLGENIKSLKISYTSSCMENPEMIMYSYKLEGGDNKWSEYSTENYHEFGQLPPGDYTFQIKARNNHGVESNIAYYSFSISRIIFLRWWAIMLYICIFAIIIYIPLQRKIKLYQKENARLDKLAQDQYNEILRQNERLKLLSLVASKNTNAIMILSNSGMLEWANDSFENFYGYKWEEYIKEFGKNFFETQKLQNPDQAFHIENAITYKERTSYEIIHQIPNQREVYAQIYLDPVFGPDNAVDNWIITETNITQLKLAEKEGMRQTEKLVEAYSSMKKNQDKMEFQTRQLRIINERLETGYKQIKRQNNTINQSLRYAHSIQASILPNPSYISKMMNYFVIYWPKDIVSGDFYMCKKVSEKSFIVIVADCTGHGVPGAFMSIIGNDILTQIILLKKITDPQTILEMLSQQLIEMLSHDKIDNTDSIALSVCKIDKNQDNATLTFAGSGSTIYIQNPQTPKIERIRGSHRQIGPSGISDNPQPYEQHIFQVEYNSRIIMFSDGIIDQCNKNRERYGTARFQNVFKNNFDIPIENIGDILEEDIKRYMEDTEQRDDITILGFSIKK